MENNYFPKLFAVLAAILVSAGLAKGAVVIDIKELGNDVVAEYSGTLDITGFGLADTPAEQTIAPSSGRFTALSDSLPDSGDLKQVRFGTVTDAPPAYGSGGGAYFATSFSIPEGNSFRISLNDVSLAPSYSSGDSLEGSLTFENESFADMNITPGTYTYTVESGDTVTITTTIPEPNSYGVLLGAAGLATAIFFRRRRRPSAV
jgi:hypothetical protein